MLLKLMPPQVIADLGAGEGPLALLLAQKAERVIAVDHSQKMADYALDVARRNGMENLDYRIGDLEELPIADRSVDIALFHQSLHHAIHPVKALEEAWRVLRPGGRVVILDLVKHGFEEARDLYADVWLGFSRVELLDFLRQAGFVELEVTVADREEQAPHFEALLAIGTKAAQPAAQC
jgi:ArsR family transcriptional regulator